MPLGFLVRWTEKWIEYQLPFLGPLTRPRWLGLLLGKARPSGHCWGGRAIFPNGPFSGPSFHSNGTGQHWGSVLRGSCKQAPCKMGSFGPDVVGLSQTDLPWPRLATGAKMERWSSRSNGPLGWHCKAMKKRTLFALGGSQSEYKARNLQDSLSLCSAKSSLGSKQGPPALKAAHGCLRTMPRYCGHPLPQTSYSQSKLANLKDSSCLLSQAGPD